MVFTLSMAVLDHDGQPDRDAETDRFRLDTGERAEDFAHVALPIARVMEGLTPRFLAATNTGAPDEGRSRLPTSPSIRLADVALRNTRPRTGEILFTQNGGEHCTIEQVLETAVLVRMHSRLRIVPMEDIQRVSPNNRQWKLTLQLPITHYAVYPEGKGGESQASAQA